MLCIVPLAGPDFHDPAYGAKPFVPVGASTLIEETVGARSWLRSGLLRPEDIVFVLRETPATQDARARLAALFPGSRTAQVSHLTGGALLSALAGLALARSGDDPVLVDLADLAFDADAAAVRALLEDKGCAGFVPWFRASDPAYSYLRLDGDRVTETAEKQVISDCASAGAYFFRTPGDFLHAAAWSLGADARVNGAFFLCPAYNGLIRAGATVRALEVTNVRAYSKDFHRQAGGGQGSA